MSASMQAILKYGDSATLEMQLPENTLVTLWAGPSGNGETAGNVAASAVQSPMEFPHLKQATVPGDHVVLALAPDVPQAANVVAAIVPALLSGAVAAEDITIVRTPTDVDTQQPDPRTALPEPLRSTIKLA
ncbi:MAG TPA: hypothetical protein VGJ15_11860, partial [Pirellulales bacterium]